MARADLHASGRPALEQVEVSLEDNEEESKAGHDSLLAIERSSSPLLWATHAASPLWVELRSLVASRIREGHGARGPPLT